MTLQNRSVLKSYFETGDFPTEEQFAELIDSMFNKVEDDAIVGLKLHSPYVAYKAGTGAIYSGALYMALVDNTGTFDVSKWQILSNPSGVLEFEIFTDFPATGASATIYIDKTSNFGYRWNGTEYILLFKLVLNSDEIDEGTTNKFYTDARSAENEKLANKGVANGYAGLDGGGKVPASQLPSFVDDVLEYADHSALPATGESGKIYVLATPYTNPSTGIISSQFRWSGSAYAEVIASPGTTDAIVEGSTNLWFTYARVRATVLTGLSTATNAVITGTNTVLEALGLLQKQITDHKADLANPHAVTKAQVGLGNADNTSDANKPVSNATQTALNLKLDISALASGVLAVVLTGFSVPASSAVVASDTILQAFGKIQAQINANVTVLATKATIGGDAPAGTYRLGTSNANSVALRTNGVDRLTIDAAGNIVQAGTATTFDIVVLRIRNTVGGFFRFITTTVAGQADIGGDFTEVNFTKPITNLKGTNNRFVETDSAGNPTAIEKIISYFIYNATVQGLLSDSANWNNANVYTGASLAGYSLEQGMCYYDSLYEYTMYSTTLPIRKPHYRVARRLHNDYASHKNVTTTLTDLINYNLPASTLNKNGDAVEMIIEGQFITPTSASFTVNVGGTPFYSKTGVAASEFVRVAVKLVRTASNVQTLYLTALYSNGTVDSLAYSGTAFTDTSAINVLVTGQDTVAGDTVEVKLFEVDFKPSV